MWIQRAEYEKLKSTAEKNEKDAELYRHVFMPCNKNDIRFYQDFVIVDFDYFQDLLNKQSEEDIEKDTMIKELRAEVEWYKVKYHEMKMQESIDNE